MAEEREILAALNHPNIARLYDAGIASNGQPYLALEYVAGRPIDEYVKARAAADSRPAASSSCRWRAPSRTRTPG